MGGNALTIKKGSRVDAPEYHQLQTEILAKIHAFCPTANAKVIASFANKQDFGDMDILVEEDAYTPIELANALGAKEIIRNGPVTSIAYPIANDRVLQVDLIKTRNIKWSMVYFSFNDLGNLMGRIAHKMGFKYGHDSLRYVLRDPEDDSHVIDEIVVTNDLETAFRIMGYDYQKYCGWMFNEIHDIFEFVINNPYFNVDIFLLHNRNNTARVRDAKRPTYMAFLKWCESTKIDNQFSYESSPQLKAEKLKMCLDELPLFNAGYSLALGRYRMKKEAKVIFNGRLVMEVTGLSGKVVGEIISVFQEPWDVGRTGDTGHFYHWVKTVGKEEVELVFNRWWKKSKERWLPTEEVSDAKSEGTL